MKRTCKKLLALVLAAVLLCSSTGCVDEVDSAQDTPSTYDMAKAAVDAGDYEKAYTLLLDLDTQTAGKEALELKEKLVCVPVRIGLKSKADHAPFYMTFEYDEKGNPVAQRNLCYDINYTYDANNDWAVQSLTTHINGMSENVLFTYDANNRLATKVQRYSNDITKSTMYTYDAASNLICAARIDSDGSKTTTTYTYDAMGHKTGQETIAANGETDKQFFTYDEEGRLMAEGDVVGQTMYTESTYTYDEDGNLLRKVHHVPVTEPTEYVYTYNHQGKVLTCRQLCNGQQIQQENYTYDDKGHLLKTVITYPEGDVATYSYDMRGRLIEDAYKSNNGEVTTQRFTYDAYGNDLSYGETRYEYTYDHLGNVITQSVDGEEVLQAEWKLVYYPNGVPEEAQKLKEAWTEERNAILRLWLRANA